MLEEIAKAIHGFNEHNSQRPNEILMTEKTFDELIAGEDKRQQEDYERAKRNSPFPELHKAPELLSQKINAKGGTCTVYGLKIIIVEEQEDKCVIRYRKPVVITDEIRQLSKRYKNISKFKVGDIVQCINVSRSAGGKVGVISRVSGEPYGEEEQDEDVDETEELEFYNIDDYEIDFGNGSTEAWFKDEELELLK